MNVRCLMLLSLATIVKSYQECPLECTCNLDITGRIQTVCNRGGMISIPIQEMDPMVEVLIIRGPRNDLTIGPIFLPLKNLEIIRITDSNLPSVGTYSFWGVERLRILGKLNLSLQFVLLCFISEFVFGSNDKFADLSRNNITAIAQDNFKGQAHLLELDLSHNKINGLTSWVFDNLQVNRLLPINLPN